MNRIYRLHSARAWLAQYQGKNVLKGYARWFGIDPMCAIAELQAIGFIFSSMQIESIKSDIAGKVCRREKRLSDTLKTSLVESDENFAYIAGYTSGGAPFGITWEEWENE